MPNRIITNITVRDKAALTTSFVMATESIYADAGNTPDTDQEFSTTGGALDLEWIARKFKSPSTATTYVSTMGVTLRIVNTGALVGSVAAYIFTDDGETTSLPSTQLSDTDASDSVTLTDITTGAGGETITFRWSTGCPVLAPSTNYWLVLQTVGYTFSSGATELNWRTDANGAVGLNECAKYDSNAGTPWTTMGADVGADLTVNEALIISTADKNQVALNKDYTQGSSTGAEIKVEFSGDRIDWVQQANQTIAGGIATYTPYVHRFASETPMPIDFPVSQPFMRVSALALTSATSAELGIAAILSYI